ncbi:hypothetical protein M427DRAFT_135297 [Gonapodya prolifera JEL478]|uniref:U-box domain-containing protein n=1 Tax=Gonapodya prolifera (strain JEL478) TaxID=1344416 RepID=A0A139AE72_GONPJ|nr:hypothetical protein M427DRAFT_135297 [Gonapodya prolifera JEL478]|eukprot:KXS15067.1 hypothetical protein M427DRAFT_135297 [Gonapodya prolifera JEL478]
MATPQQAPPLATPPQSFICPLTQQLFVDPVIDPEGNTFERAAIEEWLALNPTSPVTRSSLDPSMLAPNRALKSMVDDWCAQNNYLTAGGERISVAVPPPEQHAVSAVSTAKKNTQLRISLAAKPLSQTDLKPFDPNQLSADHDEFLLLVSVAPPVHPLSADGVSYVEPPPPARVPTTPELATTPADLIAVVDVSGSMAAEATFQDEQGKKETQGLSVLDVVKHSVRTLAHTLGPNDRLAVVSFSNDAKIVLPLTHMDGPGKATADRAIASLTDLDSTNLWAGLNTALTLFQSTPQRPTSTRSIFLLTDGQPNVEPPRGTVGMLKRARDAPGGLPTDMITAFGFGYNMDSELLYRCALESGTPGAYGFIPDSGMVGTAFVNAVSGVVSKVPLKNVVVKLELEGAGAVVHPAESDAAATGGQVPLVVAEWGAQINLGSVAYGQARDVVLRVKVPRGTAGPVKVMARLEYRGDENGAADLSVASLDLRALPDNVATQRAITYHHLRVDFARTILACVDTARTAPQGDLTRSVALLDEFKVLAARLQPGVAADEAPGVFAVDIAGNLKALLEDASGQATMALQKNFYERWGRHYLKSLARAHLLQECSNFKDPGVQPYNAALVAHSLFSRFRDTADEAFGKLKAIPTRPRARNAPPVQMGRFNNRYGGCFLPSTLVLLPDNTYKPVADLRKGDVVVSLYSPGDGTHGLGTARVRCLVTSVGEFDMVTLKGAGKGGVVEAVQEGADANDGQVVITPWHPTLTADGQGGARWVFPAEVAGGATSKARLVCSVLLEPTFETLHLVGKSDDGSGVAKPHSVVLSRSHVPVVTLAHGLLDSSRMVKSRNGGWEGCTHVVQHGLFGTESFLEVLAETDAEGYDNGHVQLF